MTAIILINVLLAGAALAGLAFVMSRPRNLQTTSAEAEPTSSETDGELEQAA